MCAVERNESFVNPLYADLDKLCKEFEEATGIRKEQKCGRMVRIIVIEEASE